MNVISSKEAYKSPIFRVTEDHAVDPGGFEIKRAIVQHGGSAVMMAIERQGNVDRILLVRQYRLPARQYMWELPAGRLDEGESPLQTAQRELREETGYAAQNWKELQAFYPSPGYVSEKMTIFIATDLTAGQAENMEDERIETKWFTAPEVHKMIESGEISDAKTMIGYYRWKDSLNQ